MLREQRRQTGGTASRVGPGACVAVTLLPGDRGTCAGYRQPSHPPPRYPHPATAHLPGRGGHLAPSTAIHRCPFGPLDREPWCRMCSPPTAPGVKAARITRVSHTRALRLGEGNTCGPPGRSQGGLDPNRLLQAPQLPGNSKVTGVVVQPRLSQQMRGPGTSHSR